MAVAVAAMLAGPLGAQELPSHDRFGEVLASVWHDGLIDYAALKAGRAPLDAYLEDLHGVPEAVVARASRPAQLAFWINAYNACALRLVIDHYPIQRGGWLSRMVNAFKSVPANSIQQIPDTWSRAFCPVAGRERSLDEIEHTILRPMGEPRIHFAVNCASRSCPRLAPTPYTADSLDVQLDRAVRTLIGDPRQYEMRKDGPATLYLNKVLDWYAGDFGGLEGVTAFLLPYLPPEDRAYAESHGPVRITFREYDWTLNDTAVFGTQR